MWWADNWQLRLNASNVKLCITGGETSSLHTPHDPPHTMEVRTEEKYLGVMLRRDLKYSTFEVVIERSTSELSYWGNMTFVQMCSHNYIKRPVRMRSLN
jgi:hypothetical protein